MLQGAGFSGMDFSGLFLGKVTCLRLSMDEKPKSTTHPVSFAARGATDAASHEILAEAEDERVKLETHVRAGKQRKP